MQPSEFIYSYLFNRLNARNHAPDYAMYHKRHALRRDAGYPLAFPTLAYT